MNVFYFSFWVHTMTTEWDLVCDRVALKTLAKLILFTGKGFLIFKKMFDF